MKTVLIVGATGLVGSAVLRLALADASIARVVVPTRRPLGSTPFSPSQTGSPVYSRP